MTQSISLSIPFSNAVFNAGANWIHMSQAAIPDNSASLGDLYQMRGFAAMGMSARDYMADCCPSTTIKEDKVFISLDIYLYPSDLAIPYTLDVEWGELSTKELVKQPVSCDIVFENSDKADFNFILEGTLVSELPFFDNIGNIISTPEITLRSTNVELATPVYTVMRVNGVSVGYKHTITMVLTSKEGYRIDNLHNSITLSYLDTAGKLVVTKLDLKFPQCALDLLKLCDDGSLMLDLTLNPPTKYHTVVYYSTCSGYVIEIRNEESK